MHGVRCLQPLRFAGRQIGNPPAPRRPLGSWLSFNPTSSMSGRPLTMLILGTIIAFTISLLLQRSVLRCSSLRRHHTSPCTTCKHTSSFRKSFEYPPSTQCLCGYVILRPALNQLFASWGSARSAIVVSIASIFNLHPIVN